MSAVQSGLFTEIKIDQQGADATLTFSGMFEGRPMTETRTAAVVESSVAIGDVAADYFSLGELKDLKLIFRPDVRVLTGWPDWAYPPKREDILECRVVLTPVGLARTRPARKPEVDESSGTGVSAATPRTGDVQPGVAIQHRFFVETPIDEVSSRVTLDPREFEGTAFQKTMQLACEYAALTANRGFGYFTKDEEARLPGGRHSSRVRFYDSPPEGALLAGGWTSGTGDPQKVVFDAQKHLNLCRIMWSGRPLNSRVDPLL